MMGHRRDGAMNECPISRILSVTTEWSCRHRFFTISVMAERNWFTSVKFRYTLAKRM